jgi:outer membrane protein assembly factor BamB
MSRWIFFCGVMVLATVSSRAEGAGPGALDWPDFRGPHRVEISPDKGLLARWPKAGPRLVWKSTGVGGGFSSVAIAGGKIFTLGNKGSVSYLFARNLDDGKPLWSTKVGAAGGNLGCTPTVDGDRVYAIGQAGDLVCAAADSGEIRWRKRFSKDFGGRSGGWQFTESPLVDGDKLVCTPGGKEATIVALDKNTGNVVWKCAVPVDDTTAGYSSIVVAEVGGIRQYVQLIAAGVVGIAADDGRFLWLYDELGNNTANIPTPIVIGNEVFCSAGYGKGGALLSLRAEGDKVTYKKVYYSHELKNKHGGIVLVGDHVYGDFDDHGTPFCAEVKTGKVLWRKDRRSPGNGSASVTYADGHLYFHFDDGTMSLVEASPQGYKQAGSFHIPNARSQSWAHPVVIGGKMYLREQDTIWCYDVKKQ